MMRARPRCDRGRALCEVESERVAARGVPAKENREFLLRHLADRPPGGALLQGIHEAANRNTSRDDIARRDQPMFLEAIMAIGTVKWFNAQKGFGFIQPDDGSPDVFVHISAVERAGMSNLAEGQKLSFEVVSERGKSAASNLQAA